MDGEVEGWTCGGLGLFVETEKFGAAFPETDQGGFGFESSFDLEGLVFGVSHQATFGAVHAMAFEIDDASLEPDAFLVDFSEGGADTG